MADVSDARTATVTRSAARGLIASMAMTGMRQVTVEAGLLEQSPPDAVLKEEPTRLLARVPEKRRAMVAELAHWAYGAGGGAAFGLLPRSLRHRTWAGPVYGLLLWLGYEAGIAPLLEEPGPRGPVERATLAADHVLYGVIVAGSSWPQRV